MPQNLDEHTRNVIMTVIAIGITVLGISNLYLQWYLIPDVRRQALIGKKKGYKLPPPPLLGLGCTLSISLMLIFSAIGTYPIVYIGKAVYSMDYNSNQPYYLPSTNPVINPEITLLHHDSMTTTTTADSSTRQLLAIEDETQLVYEQQRKDHDHALTSSINFCEPDFVDHPWVAEPSNAASSTLSYCPLALFGLIGKSSHEWRRTFAYSRNHNPNSWRVILGLEGNNRRFAVAYWTLFIIGVGSTTLHALLTAQAQGGDELPMLWFMASLSFCVMDFIFNNTINPANKSKTKKSWVSSTTWWQWICTSSAVVATVVYMFCRENFLIFGLIFGSYSWIVLAGMTWIGYNVDWKDNEFRGNVMIPLLVCTGWVSILAITSWVMEMLYCHDVANYGGPWAKFVFFRCVHAFWHCSSALLAWLMIQILLACEGFQRGWGEPRMRWFFAPYITFGKK